MGKPNYRVVVSFDPQRMVFLARAPELEHLTGEGPTRKDAMDKLEVEIDAQLANMLSQGGVPPKAVDEVDHTGEITAKVSKSLHRDLAYLAQTEGVTLDQVVSELLTQALTLRNQGRRSLGGRAQGPQSDDVGNRVEAPRQGNADGNRADGNRRPFNGGGRGQAVMEDRAHFIEYVRGLEQGGGQAQPRHGHGGAQHHHNSNNNGGPGSNNRRRRGGRGGQGPEGPRHEGQRHDGPRHEGQRQGQQGGQPRPQQAPRPQPAAPSDPQE